MKALSYKKNFIYGLNFAFFMLLLLCINFLLKNTSPLWFWLIALSLEVLLTRMNKWQVYKTFYSRSFYTLSAPLLYSPKVLQMKHFMQHGSVTTYEHCLSVAEKSFLLYKFLGFSDNEASLVRGAFLHDYFLYDWHSGKVHYHGFLHPDIAACNAIKDFYITPKEENIIRSHMWPLTLFHIPLSKEAWIVSFVDKYCSLLETLFKR